MEEKPDETCTEERKTPILKPKTVNYCTPCGFPGEYCRYSSQFPACKPWLRENCPELYPDLDAEGAEKGAEGEESKTDGKPVVKLLPGGKKQTAEEPKITIIRQKRGGKKFITSIAGLPSFGINMKDAAKAMGKKFACGASVVKSNSGGGDTVDVQGDIDLDVITDYLCTEYDSISDEVISFVEGGNKKRGKKK
mmetsp:Transcript_35899/g.40824  ORF Transcript_35899/g.40824 Transcript_35899/m.40824 type:complete len:194 (+) Transcript_35899:152-733(+)